MLPLDYLISAAVTLLVVVDPIGLAPTFLAVTAGLPGEARRSVAVRAAATAGAILIGTALVGDWLLHQLGITLPAFRIAGGLLLFSIASEMVLGVRTERESREAEHAIEEHVRNVAVFPLAVPLLAGPGAITATVLLAGQAAGQTALWPLHLVILVVVIIAIVCVCLAVFWLAASISRILGATGSMLLSRLLGVLLASLAVQYVIDGLRAVLSG